jgi:hypothetical protein
MIEDAVILGDWQAPKPVHSTDGWRVSIRSGPIAISRVVGVTRRHAVANAQAIIEAMRVTRRLSELLGSKPEDHEEARRRGWLIDILGADRQEANAHRRS